MAWSRKTPRSIRPARRAVLPHRRWRTCFTLIEVLVVVVVMGLLAGAAVLTLSRSARAATVADGVRRLAPLDELTRAAARRSGRRMAVVLSVGERTDGVPAARETDEASRETGTFTRLPPDVRIEEVWLWPHGDRGAAGRTYPDRHSDGEVTIHCSPDGWTPTYAVRLVDERAHAERWLVVAGLTGQVTEANDQRQVATIFDTLGNGRAAATSSDAVRPPAAAAARADTR